MMDLRSRLGLDDGLHVFKFDDQSFYVAVAIEIGFHQLGGFGPSDAI